MYNFTVSDVVREVRSIAEAEPDFVYIAQRDLQDTRMCSYVSAGIGLDFGRGCVVGQALEKLGVDRADLKVVEGETAIGAFMFLTGYKYDRNGKSYLDFQWLQRVQSLQDMGWSWSKSVRDADAMH